VWALSLRLFEFLTKKLKKFVLTFILHVTKYVRAMWFVNPGILSPNSYRISWKCCTVELYLQGQRSHLKYLYQTGNWLAY
jgi:hypothetical protein